MLKFKHKMFAVVLTLLGALWLGTTAGAQSDFATRSTGEQNGVFPVWALEPERLVPLAVAPLVLGGETIGVVAIYDDVATKRRADYLELYDDSGRLLAVSWFDRFGIERIAADRGFLEGKKELDGMFVMLLRGESV